MASSQMATVEINGVEIPYWTHPAKQRNDDKPSVLLAHSLFFDHTMFDQLVALLNEAGYQAITFDQPGQAGSGDATPDQLALDVVAAITARLIGHLDIGPIHFVGNSQGGMVGARLAARRPELLRSLVALGASIETEYKVAEYAPLAEHLKQFGGKHRVNEILAIMFGEDSLARGGSLIDTWSRHISMLPPRIGLATEGVIYRGSVAEELELKRELGGLAVPVLAIAGEQDIAYPPKISGMNFAQATGGRTAVIPGAGHSVALERPDEVFKVMIEHFEQST
ncbi:alpha/beta fold hydrolase [Nocardia carnea]|uniref:alpha/beta fold hydrolase n=1 Tax=Nocardia carnea TaxID=37328 RepID=UPI002455572F|nr:alpha/beta hydrolase [Nocardia carnea]